jgi:hypothetical protein
MARLATRLVIDADGPARIRSCSTLSSSMWKQSVPGNSDWKRGRKRSTSAATVWMKATRRIMFGFLQVK